MEFNEFEYAKNYKNSVEISVVKDDNFHNESEICWYGLKIKDTSTNEKNTPPQKPMNYWKLLFRR